MSLTICKYLNDIQLRDLYKAKLIRNNVEYEEHYDVKETLLNYVEQLMSDEIETKGCDEEYEYLMAVIYFIEMDFDKHWKNVLNNSYKMERNYYMPVAPTLLDFLKLAKKMLCVAAIHFYELKIDKGSEYYVDIDQLRTYLQTKNII